MSKLVIDVSQFQGAIDWAKVAPQVSAAIIRLGYRGYGAAGTLCTDPMYQRNMDGAIAAGLPVGVYWCSQALNDAEALDEARYCVDKLRGYQLTYPVLLDSEHMGPNASGQNIKALMDKYHIAMLGPDDTVENAVEEIGMDSPEYWLDVIEGRREASAANVQALMDKYHAALATNT